MAKYAAQPQSKNLDSRALNKDHALYCLKKERGRGETEGRRKGREGRRKGRKEGRKRGRKREILEKAKIF